MAVDDETEPGVDDLLVVELAAGASVKQAAERAGCSPRTVSRRLANVNFARRVSAIRGQLFAVATGKLASSAALAADKLVELLDCGQAHIEYAAARAVIELGAKLREAGELEARIAALEGGPTKQDDDE